MITSENEERRQKVAKAVFDYFVRKTFLERDFLIRNGEIDQKELANFAGRIDCDKTSISKVLRASCGRISNIPIHATLSGTEESRVMGAIMKHQIKQVKIPLKSYSSAFCRMAADLNRYDEGLNVKVKEFRNCIKPIYKELVDEIFW